MMKNFKLIVKFYFLPKKYNKLVVFTKYLALLGALYFIVISLYFISENILGTLSGKLLLSDQKVFLFIKYISILLRYPIQFFIYGIVLHSLLKLLANYSSDFNKTIKFIFLSFSTIIFRYVVETLTIVLKYLLILSNDVKLLTSFTLNDFNIVHINNTFISSFLGRIDIFLIWGIICTYYLFSYHLTDISNYKILLLIIFSIFLSIAFFVSIPLFFLLIMN